MLIFNPKFDRVPVEVHAAHIDSAVSNLLASANIENQEYQIAYHPNSTEVQKKQGASQNGMEKVKYKMLQI